MRLAVWGADGTLTNRGESGGRGVGWVKPTVGTSGCGVWWVGTHPTARCHKAAFVRASQTSFLSIALREDRGEIAMEPLNQQQHNGVYKPRFLMALVLAWLSSAGFYFWFSAGHTSDTFGGAIGYALGYLLPIALIGFFVLRKARDPASLRTRSIIIAALTIVLIASAIYEDTVALKGSIRSECAKSISAENQSNGDKPAFPKWRVV